MATVRTRSYFTNLFVTGYKPSQTNYADLFLTVPMKKETADRAKLYTGSANLETEVGLSVLATNSQAKSNATQLADRSLVVQPHQLPTVTGGIATEDTLTNDISTFSGAAVSVAADGTTTRNNYVSVFTTAFKSWLVATLNTIAVRYFKAGGTSGQVPIKTDGTDYNWAWGTLNVGTQVTGTLPVANGGTGQTTANASLNAFLPTQTGNAGEFLTTDGSNTSWAAINEGDVYKTVSTTSLVIEIASKVFTVPAGLAYQTGVRVRATSAADSANFMEGTVTSYSGTTLTVLMDTIGGSGTLADWNINIGGVNVGTWIQISAITATDFSAVNLYYQKDFGGKVIIKGRVRADAGITGGQTQELFTLPAGYRPTIQMGFRVPSFLNTSSTTQRSDCLISVETSGTVYLVLGSTETNFNDYDFMLNPVTFIAEA